jgi:hypothetical protein
MLGFKSSQTPSRHGHTMSMPTGWRLIDDERHAMAALGPDDQTLVRILRAPPVTDVPAWLALQQDIGRPVARSARLQRLDHPAPGVCRATFFAAFEEFPESAQVLVVAFVEEGWLTLQVAVAPRRDFANALETLTGIMTEAQLN